MPPLRSLRIGASRFYNDAAPTALNQGSLQRQIQNLRRTRDQLLPRLLSGRVELKTEAA